MTSGETVLPIQLWWAIGTAMVVAAPIATVWTVNRDNEFWWAVAAAAAFGAAVQPLLGRIGFRWPGSVLFGACYPIAIAGAITRAVWEDADGFGRGEALGWSIALAVAALSIVGAAVDSTVWFRWLTVAWSLVSAVLFFVYGLGIGFVPLAVAAGLAATSYGRRDEIARPDAVQVTDWV